MRYEVIKDIGVLKKGDTGVVCWPMVVFRVKEDIYNLVPAHNTHCTLDFVKMNKKVFKESKDYVEDFFYKKYGIGRIGE